MSPTALGALLLALAFSEVSLAEDPFPLPAGFISDTAVPGSF
ncbi:MAG: hypothetical protein R3B54_00805 [Bdellovibrionota bacterium]